MKLKYRMGKWPLDPNFAFLKPPEHLTLQQGSWVQKMDNSPFCFAVKKTKELFTGRACQPVHAMPVTITTGSHPGLAPQCREGSSFRYSQSFFPKSHSHREEAHTWNGFLPEAQMEKTFHILSVPGIISAECCQMKSNGAGARTACLWQQRQQKAEFRWPHSKCSRNQGSWNTLWPGSAFTVGFTHSVVWLNDFSHKTSLFIAEHFPKE